jgi:hypothetical protein
MYYIYYLVHIKRLKMVFDCPYEAGLYLYYLDSDVIEYGYIQK